MEGHIERLYRIHLGLNGIFSSRIAHEADICIIISYTFSRISVMQDIERKHVILDCTTEFLNTFGQAFSKFNIFNDALKYFEDRTGTKYIMNRHCLFNEGTLDREFLVYKFMNFVCIRHGKTVGKKVNTIDCPAYFSVRTLKHKLVVRHYDVQHNHVKNLGPNPNMPICQTSNSSAEEQSTSNSISDQYTVKDCTEEFLKHFPSTSFSSFSELQAKMDDFQIKTGCRYVKTNTRCLPPNSPESSSFVYSHLVYICYRYGSNHNEPKIGKIQRTSKIGCRSKIYIFLKDNQLHIRRYDLRHNHDVRPDLVHFLPKKRKSKKLLPLHILAPSFKQINGDNDDFADIMDSSPPDNLLSLPTPDPSEIPTIQNDLRFGIPCSGINEFFSLLSSSLSIPSPKLKKKVVRKPRKKRPVKNASGPSTRKKKSPLDNIIPELGSYLQRLGELATYTDTDSFMKRLEELKALGDKWCHQDDGIAVETEISSLIEQDLNNIDNPRSPVNNSLHGFSEFVVSSSSS